MSNTRITNEVKKFFGKDLRSATLCQKLVLIEAIAILLRRSADSFGHALDIAVSDDDEVGFPDRVLLYDDVFETPDEGLLLMSELHSAIVEDFSVLAKKTEL